MAKTTKDKLEAGDKKRAGRLLSNFIRQIAQEKINCEVTEGELREITKAEALARQIFDRALGRFKAVDKKTGKIVFFAPDKDMINIIFDRMEGKVGTVEDVKKKDASVPDMVSRENKKRINKLATGKKKDKGSLKS